MSQDAEPTPAAAVAQPSRAAESIERVLVCVALALATGLRLYNLGAESLWNDELATVSITRFGPLAGQTWDAISRDVHPPGYYFFIAVWQLAFGDSEFSLRLPSALAGIALCWALYAFARRFLSPAVAIGAIYLSAVSPFLIKYSQEARAYSLVCLLVTWVADTWLQLCQPQSADLMRGAERRRIVTAGVAFAAASYVHYSGLIAASLIVALLAAYSLVAQRSALSLLRNALLLALVLYSPWVPGLVDSLARGGLSFLKPPELADALSYPGTVLPVEVWIALGVIAAIGAAILPRRVRWTKQAPATAPLPRPIVVIFLLCWAVLTIALMYIKSRISTPIFNERNLIVVAPPILLVAAIAISLGAEAITGQLLMTLTLVCGLSLRVLIVDENDYSGEHKEQYRQATQLALEQVRSMPDVRVVALCHARHFDYYLRRLGSPLTLTNAVPRSSRVVAAVDEAWATGAGHVLLLWGHIALGKSARKSLATTYHVLSEQDLRGAGYILLSR